MRIKGIAKLITVLALVGSVSMPVFAGAVGGPRKESFSLAPGESRTFTFSFYGGLASVIVQSDANKNPDVYVYDAAGNLITKGDDYSDTCVVQWRALWTGMFQIRVVNRRGVFSTYSIESN